MCYCFTILEVDSGKANEVMGLIRSEFLSGDISKVEGDDSGIDLTGAEEFT